MIVSADVRFATGMSEARVIYAIGIVRATARALSQALRNLKLDPMAVRVDLDGLLHAPKQFKHQHTIVKGDEKEVPIALVSIAAKVTRDRLMRERAHPYPEYGFERHVGYGTKKHYEAITKNGLTDLHRRSFVHIR